MKFKFTSLCSAALLFGFCLAAQAQWQTQSLLIKPGWTAVYLHVDPSFQTLDQSVGVDFGNPISEIWLWVPSPTGQFASNPQIPTTPSSQWANWGRLALGGNNSLNTLVPNAAYLVHSVATTNYIWRILGKPVAPNYSWTIAGLNFLDFPTVPTNPPKFDSFLALATNLQPSAATTEIYQYPGGDLSATNPSRVFSYHTTPVPRGQAYWMRSGTLYNNYFGPFQVVLSGAASSGVSFGDYAGQVSFHLRNVATSNLTVTLTLLASEPPPAGQAPIAGTPPLLIRGALTLSNLTYAVSPLPLGGTRTWSLAPAGQSGSDIEVVLGVNRYAMTNSPGASYAGILQFTDSFGFTELDVPVSALAASTAGLWIGSASVTQVRNYLKLYQRDNNNALVVSTNGNYVVTSINTNFGPVARPYPLQLIVHTDGTNAVLLQRIYYGLDRYTNIVIANTESALDPSHLDSARRVSVTHLPWSAANAPWPFSGHFGQGQTLTTTADLAYDDQTSNPFLHTYHPDHDNLDATFKTQLAQGYESYRATRIITLAISPPSDDFESLTGAGQTVSGAYLETLVLSGLGGASRNLDVAGVFSLKRMSTIPFLTRQ